MKNNLKNNLIILFFAFIIAFSSVIRENAIARKVQGVYLFHYSEPVAKYEVVDTHNLFFDDGVSEEAVKFSLKRCAKKTPQANGIIFSDDMKSYTAIIME